MQKKNEGLEKRLLLLVSQNCKQKKENKSLWKEIQKNKYFSIISHNFFCKREEYDQKIEKLLNLYFLTKANINPEALRQKNLVPLLNKQKKTSEKTIKIKKTNVLDNQSKKIKKQRTPLQNQKARGSPSSKDASFEEKNNMELMNYEGETMKNNNLFLWSSSSKHQHKTDDLSLRDYLEECGYFEGNENNIKKENIREDNINNHFLFNEKMEENENDFQEHH